MLHSFNSQKTVGRQSSQLWKSEAPQSGYSLDDHASDIEAAVKASGLAEYCLMTHSLGVPYAIRFAAKHPGVSSEISSNTGIVGGMDTRASRYGWERAGCKRYPEGIAAL